MKHRQRCQIVLLLVLALSACASPDGPPFELSAATEGKARIYAFRTASIVGGGNSDIVAINGRFIGRLNSGTYSVYEVEPGPVTVSRKGGSIFFGEGEEVGWGLGALSGAIEGYIDLLEFDTEPGRIYFVRFPHGELVANEQALELMDRLEDVTPAVAR